MFALSLRPPGVRYSHIANLPVQVPEFLAVKEYGYLRIKKKVKKKVKG